MSESAGWHSGLPWGALRRLYRLTRKRYFSVDPPSGPYVRVDASLAEVERLLGQYSYAPNWEFSYHYRGEDLNLARVEYHESDEHEGRVWWQTHVRGWDPDHVEGVILHAHWELEPTERDNTEAHIEGAGLDNQRGMDTLRVRLDEAGLSHEPFDGEVLG